MAKRTKRQRTSAVTGGGAYKKGAMFPVQRRRHDQVQPGIVLTPKELAAQYRIMLGLKREGEKLLHAAQQQIRKLERGERLLAVVESIDTAVQKLETSLGVLQALAARFAVFSSNSRETIVAEAQRYPADR